MKHQYQIQRKGHALKRGANVLLSIPKIEMTDGKLFNTDDDRIHVLALLLECVGVDATIRLAPLGVWREAIAHLDQVH